MLFGATDAPVINQLQPWKSSSRQRSLVYPTHLDQNTCHKHGSVRQGADQGAFDSKSDSNRDRLRPILMDLEDTKPRYVALNNTRGQTMEAASHNSKSDGLRPVGGRPPLLEPVIPPHFTGLIVASLAKPVSGRNLFQPENHAGLVFAHPLGPLQTGKAAPRRVCPWQPYLKAGVARL